MFDNVLNRENNIQKVSTSLEFSTILCAVHTIWYLKSIIHNCLKHSKILSFFMVHDMELNISRVIFDSTVKI